MGWTPRWTSITYLCQQFKGLKLFCSFLQRFGTNMRKSAQNFCRALKLGVLLQYRPEPTPECYCSIVLNLRQQSLR